MSHFQKKSRCRISIYCALAAFAMSLLSSHTLADGVPSNPPADTWVAFGDSLVEGMTYPLWVSQSLAKAGRPVPYWVNAGVGGNTLGQMLARMDRDVLAYHPQRVFFNDGINDLLQHKSPGEPKDFRQNIDTILSKLKRAGISVCVTTTP